MPTTRLMQFSPGGQNDEAVSDGRRRGARPLSGISSAHFLRLVEERGRAGFWTLDFATNHVTTSVGLYRLFGIDPSVPLGRDDLLHMMHPDDRPLHRDMVETMQAGHAIDRVFRIIRPDGTVRWLQAGAEVTVDAEGRPARAVGVMTDITDQHAARQSVENGWRRYRAMTQAMALVELRLKAGGDDVALNRWSRLTGQTAAQVAGYGWLDAVHPEDLALSDPSWSSFPATASPPGPDPRAAEDGRSPEFRIRCADGSYQWFTASAAPPVTVDATVREWIGALFAMAGYGEAAPHAETEALAASHIRAARALLDWTIHDLARHAAISVSSVRRLETRDGRPIRDRLLRSVRKAFEANGVSFTSVRPGTLSLHVTPRSDIPAGPR